MASIIWLWNPVLITIILTEHLCTSFCQYYKCGPTDRIRLLSMVGLYSFKCVLLLDIIYLPHELWNLCFYYYYQHYHTYDNVLSSSLFILFHMSDQTIMTRSVDEWWWCRFFYSDYTEINNRQTTDRQQINIQTMCTAGPRSNIFRT